MANAATELPLLAKRLKVAGEAGLKREMVRGLREAAAPVIPQLRDAARADLPRRGGLNDRVANQPIKVSVRTSGRRSGVSIRAQWTRTNSATWRHPVFGHTDRWVSQTYAPAKNWFDETAQKNSLPARARMDAVLKVIAAQVNGLGI